MTNELEWLQEWYAAQCDGNWEHGYGISIGTLDNPGWSVTIDLAGTPLEDRPFDTVRRDLGDQDWLHVDKRAGQFFGRGDPSKLKEMLAIFMTWVVQPESYKT